MRFWISSFFSLCLLLSCTPEEAVIDNDIKPTTVDLKEFSFLSLDNSPLDKDIKCDIIGDTLIECWIPQFLENKKLVPHIVYDADTCFVDSEVYVAKESKVDFRKQVLLQLRKNGKRKDYKVQVHSFTGLPVAWLNTGGCAEIVSKDEYLVGSIQIKEDIEQSSSSDTAMHIVYIKGRGHSTWKHYPKKPYRLKFEVKTSILSMPKDKAWVLIANYYDNTLMRNHIGYWLGSISNLDYTPRFQYVEVILNGEYKGTYEIGEKLKISKYRVDVGDNGFLLEYASNEGLQGAYFYSNHLRYPFYIKDPDVEIDSDTFVFAKKKIVDAEDALYSETFTDSVKGWRAFLDNDSFVDYYVINEIAKNVDAVCATSTFFNFTREGKIKMGPLWDFDSAFGNEVSAECDKPEGFYTRLYGWYPQLFNDPYFVSKVKERFDYFYDRKDKLFEEIDKTAYLLRISAEKNNGVWRTFEEDAFNHHHLQGGYANEVAWLKDWLQIRFKWLKKEFDKM